MYHETLFLYWASPPLQVWVLLWYQPHADGSIPACLSVFRHFLVVMSNSVLTGCLHVNLFLIMEVCCLPKIAFCIIFLPAILGYAFLIKMILFHVCDSLHN